MPEPRSLPVRRGNAAATHHELRDQEYFTELAYRKSGRSRYTQDSPILADVIVHYGLLADKTTRLDLLLTPDWSKDPADVADELRDWLGERHEGGAAEGDWKLDDEEESRHAIAYNQSVVAVRLTFDELVCNVLPMSWWWQNQLIALDGRNPVDICTDEALCEIARGQLVAGLQLEIAGEEGAISLWDKSNWLIRQDLAWAARLFYVVMCSNLGGRRHRPADDAEEIADFFFGLVKRIAARQEVCRDAYEKAVPETAWVYSVNRNRPIEPALFDSVPTTKADAASHTFSVTGSNICWAVIDTGIDARHAAFRKIDGDTPRESPFGADGSRNNTRIKATYDFSNIRVNLSKAQQRAVKAGRLLDWERLETELALRVPHTERGYRTPLQAHGTHVAGILAANWRPDPLAVDPIPGRRRPGGCSPVRWSACVPTSSSMT